METYNVLMSRHIFNMAAADAVELAAWKIVGGFAAIAGVACVVTYLFA